MTAPRRSYVLDVNEWMSKADDLLSEITTLVSTNSPTNSTTDNNYPQLVDGIRRGVVELGFGDVIHFCESFPAKFVIDTASGLITLPTGEETSLDTPTRRVLQQPKMIKKKKEVPKPKPERKKHSNSSHKKQSTQTTEKKVNIDDATMALLANYNPVPPSLRVTEKKEAPQSVEPVKKTECIHFKFAHEGKMRRFAFPRDYSSLIGSVKNRVQDIMGEKRDLLLYWRDDESLIILECGEDMQAAIDFAESQMKPPTCITIEADVEKGEEKEKRKEVKKEEEEKVERQEEEKKPRFVSRDESSASFNGFAFMCDSCDCYLSSSNGGRYKCMICDNYDLCAACVAKGVHYNHALVRLLNAETAVPLADANGGSRNVPLRMTRRCTPAFLAKNVVPLSTVKQTSPAPSPVEQQPANPFGSIGQQLKANLKKERTRLEKSKKEQVKTDEEVASVYFDTVSSLPDRESLSLEQAVPLQMDDMQMEKYAMEKRYNVEDDIYLYHGMSEADRERVEQEDREAWRQLQASLELQRQMEEAEKELRKEQERRDEGKRKEEEKKKLEVVIDAETKQIKTIDEERKKIREEKRNKENREWVEEEDEEERVNPMLSSLFKLLQKEEKEEEFDVDVKDLFDLEDLFESDSDPPFSMEGDIDEIFDMDKAAAASATPPTTASPSPIPAAAADQEPAADAAAASPPSPLATAIAVPVGNVNLDSENGKIVWSSERWMSNADPGVVTKQFLQDREDFLSRSMELYMIPAHLERLLLSEMHDSCGHDLFPARLERYHDLVSGSCATHAFQQHELIFSQSAEVENEMIRLIASDLADRLKMMKESVGFALPEIRRKMIWGRICELGVLIGEDERFRHHLSAIKLRPILCNDTEERHDEICADTAQAAYERLDQACLGEHIEWPRTQRAASSCASSVSIVSSKCSSDGSDIEVIEMPSDHHDSILETSVESLESKFADLEFKSIASAASTELVADAAAAAQAAAAAADALTAVAAAAAEELLAPAAAADSDEPPAYTRDSSGIAQLTDDMFRSASSGSAELIDFDKEPRRLRSSSQKPEEAFPSEEWMGPDQEEMEAELQSFFVESRRNDVKNIPAFMEYNILLELHDMENAKEVPLRLEHYCSHVSKNTKNLKEHKTILSQDKETDKELVKRIAVDLTKRLQNMRKIVDYAMPCTRKGMILNRVCELRAQIKEFKYDELWFETVCRDLHTILLTNEYTISYNPMESIERGWKFVFEHANGFVQQAKATAPKLGEFLHPHQSQSISNSGPPPPFASTDPLKNESTDDEEAETSKALTLPKKVPTVKSKPSAAVQIEAEQLMYDVKEREVEPFSISPAESSSDDIAQYLSPQTSKKTSLSWDPWEDEYPVEPTPPVPSAPEEPETLSGLSAAAAAAARSLGGDVPPLREHLAAPREDKRFNLYERRASDEELTDGQQRLLSELFETGIFDDYERMVYACRMASNLEQAIELMLVDE